MKTTIYVATHRRCNELLKLSHPYVPIHAGKASYNSEDDWHTGYLPELGDNTGDNISSKNYFYSELTAMYWVWKNDKSDPEDIVGLNHYRRYFQSLNSAGNLMTEEDMRNIIFDRGFNFIINGYNTNVPDPTRLSTDCIYCGYQQQHNIKDLDNAIQAIHEMFPDVAGRMEYELKHSGVCSYCNMLITTKKHFDEYASFLFPVLQYVEDRIKYNSYVNAQHDGWRVPGYVAERLMRPWILAKGYSAEQGEELFWNI